MRCLPLLLALGTASCFSGRSSPASPASAETDARLKRIEAFLAQHQEAIEFLAKVYAEQKAQQARAEDSEPAENVVFAVGIADDVRAGFVEGPATAPVTIVKAFDFACPHCASSSTTMTELVKQYNGKVRVVFKNMVVHDIAMPAHLASCAAAKQGKYLAFKTAFWDKGFAPFAASGGQDRAAIDTDHVIAIAKDVGLDVTKLKAEMGGAACKQLVDADMAELAKFKVSGTPMFWINGYVIAGAAPKAEFEQIIDARLKEAEASGVPAAQYYDREVLAKGEKQFVSKKDKK